MNYERLDEATDFLNTFQHLSATIAGIMQALGKPQISDKLRQTFLNAKSVVVLTGAGVSAESGVPTFRGGGQSAVWKGLPFDVISSARMVARDLPAVWEWFDYRRHLLEALQPNPAHYQIAKWQDRFPEFTVVTQNVDGLHQKAGSREVTELHGSIWRARCISCASRYELSRGEQRPDACLSCGDPVRPDVVLFGELLPPGAFEQAAAAAANCELCFVVGTSALVYPAAGLPEVARSAGAYICEVNPERTPLSSLCDEVVMGKAGEVLPLFGEFLCAEGAI
ncbi:MAG TPA: NAD-dependent deacylase [Pyrinomonadaceae bacterium]|nr:NAD-dependent deacylase [Pyrinomonadaceae bacterium]